MRQRVHNIIASFALLVLAISVSLIVAEAVARFAFRDITTTRDNTSYFAKRWYQKHPPIVNRWGFREREFSQQRSSSTYRIAVVGDSFTYGQGILIEDRLTNITDRRLKKISMRYEVLNFGRPGAETIDHVEILKNIVLDVQPNYVLLQWFINDVEGRSGVRPQPWRLLPSDILTSLLHSHSALYYLLNMQWIKFQKSIGTIGSYQDYMISRFKDPNGEDAREARGALEVFFALCRKQNVPVGMVLFPELTEQLQGKYALGFLMDRVLETCRKHKVTCVDLRPRYASVTPITRLWANRLDSHPGPFANELAVEAVLKNFGPVWNAELNSLPPAPR